MSRALRLGLNIDHVATVRNARGAVYPDPVRIARAAADSGAVDGLTVHLREDRRHIRDADVAALRAADILPINLEMAATGEMTAIALETQPHAVCLVPERREELTTEGGLNVAEQVDDLTEVLARLRPAAQRLTLFVDADPRQIAAAKAVGADAVELHTGPYTHADGPARADALQRLRTAAAEADRIGLEVHAGHGLDYVTVGGVAAIPEIVELNIGHFLIGEALAVGIDAAVLEMRRRMDTARAGQAAT